MAKIEYNYDAHGPVLPNHAPFDGKPVLIKLKYSGWCEAYWELRVKEDGWFMEDGGSGFNWVCLNGHFRAKLPEAEEWLPLPSELSP